MITAPERKIKQDCRWYECSVQVKRTLFFSAAFGLFGLVIGMSIGAGAW